jgi:hypothetical protein
VPHLGITTPGPSPVRHHRAALLFVSGSRALGFAAVFAGGVTAQRVRAQDEPALLARKLQELSLTRALAIEAPARASLQFRSAPASTGSNDVGPLIWQAFFSGALLKVSLRDSSAPVALHLNPLLDVAVLQSCSREPDRQGRYCRTFCALPGEVLSGATPTGMMPFWLGGDLPLVALRNTALERLRSFEYFRSSFTDSSGTYCRSRWHELAEYRILRAIQASQSLDREQLGMAMSRYYGALKDSNQSVPSAQVSIGLLLGNLDQFNLAGVVALPSDRLLLLFSPKRSGWHMVALLYDASQPARILNATAFSFSGTTND